MYKRKIEILFVRPEVNINYKPFISINGLTDSLTKDVLTMVMYELRDWVSKISILRPMEDVRIVVRNRGSSVGWLGDKLRLEFVQRGLTGVIFPMDERLDKLAVALEDKLQDKKPEPHCGIHLGLTETRFANPNGIIIHYPGEGELKQALVKIAHKLDRNLKCLGKLVNFYLFSDNLEDYEASKALVREIQAQPQDSATNKLIDLITRKQEINHYRKTVKL